MEFYMYLFIGFAGLVITTLFTMSGGIGLVLRPLMIFVGVPPQITIATARLSSITGDIVSLNMLNHSKKIDWKLVILLAPMYVIGGLFGIFIITSLNDILLKKTIGFMLLFGGAVMILKKEVTLKQTKSNLGRMHLFISWPVMFTIGAFLVILGGIGPLSRLFFIFGYGKSQIEAAALQKAIGFCQTIITAFVFIYLMLVDWWLFIVLAISGGFGNYIETKLVLKRGEKFLYYLLLIIILVSSIKLIFFT